MENLSFQHQLNKMSRHYTKIFFFFLFTNLTIVKAQLFHDKTFYPQTSSQKVNYFNGSGGGGYWSLKKFDSLGRTTELKNYRKAKLLHITKYIYNSNNDIVYLLDSRDKDNLMSLDTSISFEYQYLDNNISFQKRVMNSFKNNLTVIKLVENCGDSLIIYRETNQYYRPKTKKTDEFNIEYTLSYKNGLLASLKEYNVEEKLTKVTYWEYYPDGNIKRRKIIRKPVDKIGSYVGVPASDDMYYIYSFDKKGRITKLYHEIDGRKFKIAVYTHKS